MSIREPKQVDGLPLRLKYQRDWCAERARFAVCEKGRRIGLSWADASERVTYAAEGRGDVYYQSYNKDMTETYIADCAEWAQKLEVAVSRAVKETIVADGESINRFRIDFGSGKRIIALSSNPRVLRSKGRPGDVVVIDEAAFCDDLPALLKAATAVTQWGGIVRIISTHNGESNPFNRLVGDIRDGRHAHYALHRITLDDAIADGLVRRVFSTTGRDWYAGAAEDWRDEIVSGYTDPQAAREELFCIPRQGGSAWLSWAEIRAALHPDAGSADGGGAGRHFYIGIDIARRRDLWVAAVVEVVGDVRWLRELRTGRDISFADQYAIVAELIGRYRPIRVAVDQTGMGEAVVERLQQQHGTHLVEGVILSAPRRLDVATALREVAQDRRLRIPDDDLLRADLHSIKAETGATGGPRLTAEAAGTDGHADRFWALALAIAAAQVPMVKYRYDPVRLTPRRERFRRHADDDDDFSDSRLVGYGGLPKFSRHWH